MNKEQKMVKNFMSRLGQQKSTHDLPRLTWRTREEPEDEHSETSLCKVTVTNKMP